MLARALKLTVPGARTAAPAGAARRALVLVTLVSLLLGPAAPAAGGSAPRGGLHALGGPGACLGPGSGCGRLRGARGLDQLAVSPDGRTVYLAGAQGGVAVLARDRRTGRLHQLRGGAGCLRSDGASRCSLVRALVKPEAVSLSRDGRSLYVAVSEGIIGFARNPRTGTLQALPGAGGCVAVRRVGCSSLRGVSSPSALLLAADGRTAYLAGQGPSDPNGPLGGLAVLARDPATGRLTQLSGAAGCLDARGADGCTSAPCLEGTTALALSRDGRQLYSVSSGSLNIELTSPGAVATFARTPADGTLALVGCVRPGDAVSDLVVAPTGRSVFVATVFGNRGTGVARAGIDLYAPGAHGALVRRRQLSCAGTGGRRCAIPFGPDAELLAMTPRGDTLYAGDFFGGVTALRVTRTGLARLPGGSGCVVAASYYMPPARCARAGPLIAGAIVVSPDGRNLYVATLGNGRGSYYAGGVAVLALQR